MPGLCSSEVSLLSSESLDPSSIPGDSMLVGIFILLHMCTWPITMVLAHLLGAKVAVNSSIHQLFLCRMCTCVVLAYLLGHVNEEVTITSLSDSTHRRHF